MSNVTDYCVVNISQDLSSLKVHGIHTVTSEFLLVNSPNLLKPFNMKLRLKIAPAACLGSSVLPAICHSRRVKR